ncbi:hypothetical protein [Streptacidiphilus albus]|uniref:hypothetical protein n=1 Tax=Streptacidiphilus albus TaxID=105425 RepID=UPI00054BA411|nr:hypothetical protein [Streptacidiphilus albus]
MQTPIPTATAPDVPVAGTATQQRARRVLVGMAAVAAVALLGTVAWVVRIPLQQLPYTTGRSGMAGSFTAQTCVTKFSGRSGLTTCRGTFVAASGTFSDPSVTVYNDGVHVGEPASYRRTSSGGYVRTGAGPAGRDIAGILALASVALLIVEGFRAVARMWPGRTWRSDWGWKWGIGGLFAAVALLAVGSFG